ncbi:hypothetical protein D8B26_004586 [Coccidioides posadasii str. Silveira]|uniref:Mitochondrial adapter protein MCP1 transmembrane domain-containing protein n=3 Tax=Coccidioides posadasii TaxID=199306 RepID=E9DEJ1_COCPS|nr:hypothetical protein CPC735_061400 [Coccidioides posadasii C735 delta SOWgp]EER28267.1 hypothetical protein CPC735_061400 [Coccidioides posadasii C735 delta SOWgp]EFW15053.1 conserved hypothetical protein [Coccidioides posadasii str. Silveira]KMM68822.1 hypothetical protein CPAG_05146 [Coccidioides posadasii RMSCC 3488]QVM09925.1 hypothetical protein D8B26_004586 [Coccidioides posadasii str. Silveira]|eukprot:XP_003070412.1 hypothetical protein CPC735_061400 [Coccidioides posadasii C735 delta SOWgp]
MGEPEDSSPYLHELEPVPDEEVLSALENGLYTPKPPENGVDASQSGQVAGTQLGLSGRSWEYWLSQVQRYSTYPPSIFFGLHLVNTSLIPLATQSIEASETYLLLTRPIYQAPVLEPALLTVPILAHIASGIALRFVRQSRCARLYGAETRQQRKALRRSNRSSIQAKLGYFFVPFLGLHVLVNRIGPWYVDGGSSSVGLGYVAHGVARSPWTVGAWYVAFVGIGVWHFVGGWAHWMGWREMATLDRAMEKRRGATAGFLGNPQQVERLHRQKRRRWIIAGSTVAGTALWLSGGLGVVGRGGLGSGWEAKTWDNIYSQIPLLGPYLVS